MLLVRIGVDRTEAFCDLLDRMGLPNDAKQRILPDMSVGCFRTVPVKELLSLLWQIQRIKLDIQFFVETDEGICPVIFEKPFMDNVVPGQISRDYVLNDVLQPMRLCSRRPDSGVSFPVPPQRHSKRRLKPILPRRIVRFQRY